MPWPTPSGTDGSRSLLSMRCRCIGAWTSARPSPQQPTNVRCRITASTWWSPATTSLILTSSTWRAPRWPESPHGARAGAGGRDRAVPAWPHRPHGRCRVAGRPYVPSFQQRVAALGPVALHSELSALDPVAAGRMEPTNMLPGGASPGGHARQRPPVQFLRPRAGPVPADRVRAGGSAVVQGGADCPDCRSVCT